MTTATTTPLLPFLLAPIFDQDLVPPTKQHDRHGRLVTVATQGDFKYGVAVLPAYCPPVLERSKRNYLIFLFETVSSANLNAASLSASANRDPGRQAIMILKPWQT
jgi:hypothetical protein